MPSNANTELQSLRKKFRLSGISLEYKDLAKIAEDIDSYPYGEELGDS